MTDTLIFRKLHVSCACLVEPVYEWLSSRYGRGTVHTHVRVALRVDKPLEYIQHLEERDKSKLKNAICSKNMRYDYEYE